MNNKRAVTLTEVLIAIAIGMAILVPSVAVFSTSSRVVEKSRNLSFASGLARYIIQGMMTMKMNDITSISAPGVSVCDQTDKNIYFKDLFNMIEQRNDLKKGAIALTHENLPAFYGHLARYEFRYSIYVGEVSPDEVAEDIVKSVTVFISWKEFGVDKSYESHAYIIPR